MKAIFFIYIFIYSIFYLRIKRVRVVKNYCGIRVFIIDSLYYARTVFIKMTILNFDTIPVTYLYLVTIENIEC